MNTPLLQDWLGDDKEKRHRREVHFPTGRFGEAIEQAHMVVFLASDDSSFVNAQEMIVDGGMTRVGFLDSPFCKSMYSWNVFQAYVTPEGPSTEAPRNNAFI